MITTFHLIGGLMKLLAKFKQEGNYSTFVITLRLHLSYHMVVLLGCVHRLSYHP